MKYFVSYVINFEDGPEFFDNIVYDASNFDPFSKEFIETSIEYAENEIFRLKNYDKKLEDVMKIKILFFQKITE